MYNKRGFWHITQDKIMTAALIGDTINLKKLMEGRLNAQ